MPSRAVAQGDDGTTAEQSEAHSALEASLTELTTETRRKLYLPLLDAMQGYGAFRHH